MGSSYRHWFKILKSGDKVSISKNNYRGLIMATRIVEAGLATWDKEMDWFTYYTISPIAHNQPKPTPTPSSVQVCWWQSGARQGLFSQQAYDVISEDDNWVTVSLMGKPKAVRREHTRVAA